MLFSQRQDLFFGQYYFSLMHQNKRYKDTTS